METLPNRSRYQSFAVKVYVVAVVAAAAAAAAVLVVVGVDNVADVDDYDVGETMMADDVDALTVEATVNVVVVVVVDAVHHRCRAGAGLVGVLGAGWASVMMWELPSKAPDRAKAAFGGVAARDSTRRPVETGPRAMGRRELRTVGGGRR